MRESELEETFALQILAVELPQPVREHRFHPVRKWRFDFAWPWLMLAVEVEGGTWANGRHTRGAGYERDTEKYNAAVELGWRVFRYTAKQVEDGSAIAQIEHVIKTWWTP